MDLKLVKVEAGVHREIAVKANQLEALIKALYAAVATIATDTVNKNLVAAVGGWATLGKGVERELGTSLLPHLMQTVRTGEIDEDEATASIKEFRRAIRSVLKADTSVGHDELEMLNSLSAYLVNRSDAVFNKVVKLLPSLGDQVLTDSFVIKAKSQKDFVKPLERIVFAATKAKGRSVLTADESKVLKAKSPAVYKEYLRLRKDFNQVWKDELRNLVFESKKQAINFEKAVRYLETKGIKHNLPAGFTGLVDANGRIYTSAGKVIAGLPGPGFSIRMNPDYNPAADNSYVFTTINDSTGKVSQHVYTETYKKIATQEKFVKVENLDKVIDTVRAKWMRHVKAGGKTPQAVASTILELLYAFSARIGSVGNTTANKSTYGIATLLGKHVKITPSGIVIAYPGKKGVRQVHKLVPASLEGKLLVRNLTEYAKGKGANDRIFTFESPSTGREIPMVGALVNKWLAKLGSPANAHKLRHVRGTRLFNELVKANEEKLFNPTKPLTEIQATRAFLQIAGKVGQILGHVKGVGAQQKVTPSTAIQNYINPVDMMQFFQRLGMRPPKFLSKFKDED